jgi:MYXO-CTERM domain-containing protein
LFRLLGLSALFVSLSVMSPTLARADHDRDDDQGEHHESHTRAVPELSASGAGSAFALIAGAGAIAFGRRRKKQ